MATLDLILAGDLVLDEPDPDYWLGGIAPCLRAADVAIGHLEVPHSLRGTELDDDVPAPGADPAHLPAIARAGFRAVSLAGNHIADLGAEGIADTIAGLDEAGLAHAGAGATLDAARAAAFLRGTRSSGGAEARHLGGGDTRDNRLAPASKERVVALLSYNCVGPQAGWADARRAGCAYVRVEATNGAPIAPSSPLERIDPSSVAEMARNIASAKERADIVVVALHKGIVHTRAKLAPYERPLAHAAIDAGCDIVCGHHAHIVRGIEIYRGKPIFHGLGNGCVVTRALSPSQSHPARAAWARKRRELFGFEPDPAYSLAPFHPEAVNGMLGRVRVHEDGSLQIGFVPVFVEPPGRPTIAPPGRAAEVAGYISRITQEAGLAPLSLELTTDGAWLR
ncbi:MAG TPA: CapA family protein [Steroidobacteraceae bacterium]|nr:CapA family protein [Steroidobacteraceae bacterium]